MKTIKLGRTGLEVSPIGMGGLPIQRPPEDEAIRVIQRCLDLGVTFIDTARSYGTSEERIGKAITGRRDQIVIATKTGYRDKNTALKDLELSLQHLQTDYIDLWQFHSISTVKSYEQVLGPEGALEAAQEALKANKVRHIGFSSHSLDVAEKAITSGFFETVQFPLNFVCNEAEERLVSLAQEHDVGFIAMKPFAGGMLKDANLAIKYLLQFDNIVLDPGIEKVEEIEEIIDIVNGSWELTLNEQQKMDNLRMQLGTRLCRLCVKCLPCPQGVIIPHIMIIPIFWKLWPQEELLSSNHEYRQSFESGKNCNQCGECEEKCPYNLPIRKMITENMEFYDSMKS
jgi:predicted aldo/keto reductase-like oxidoreductase